LEGLFERKNEATIQYKTKNAHKGKAQGPERDPVSQKACPKGKEISMA